MEAFKNKIRVENFKLPKMSAAFRFPKYFIELTVRNKEFSIRKCISSERMLLVPFNNVLVVKRSLMYEYLYLKIIECAFFLVLCQCVSAETNH